MASVEIEPIEPRVLDWLHRITEGCKSVVELGAGRFEKIGAVSAPWRVGLEICDDYIRAFPRNDLLQVQGDMRHFNGKADCFLLIDSLEHLEKSEGFELLTRLQVCGKRIGVFSPIGEQPQTEDAWGFDNPHQAHRSSWWPEASGQPTC